MRARIWARWPRRQYCCRTGVEPILQLACRDRNRIALQSDLLAAAALGIENLLLLRGDDPSAGDQPDAKPVFDIDSLALTEVARRIRDRQELMSGQKVAGKARFLLGTADAPVDPPAGWKPTRLKSKIDAGAQFAQTQFCMDAGVVRRYAQCLADNGLGGFFLLIGLAPIRSARSARWIRDKLPGSIVPDAVIERLERSTEPVREGRKICLELVEELSELPGAAGVHIMAPGNDAGLAEVVAEAAHIAARKPRKPPEQQGDRGPLGGWRDGGVGRDRRQPYCTVRARADRRNTASPIASPPRSSRAPSRAADSAGTCCH